jgi:hypothetical protein
MSRTVNGFAVRNGLVVREPGAVPRGLRGAAIRRV